MTTRVMVVEDESDIRRAMIELLSEEGYQVASAGDGVEALSQVRAFHPQLLLLDLMMPRMNGWQLRAALRDDPELRSIPVLVLSALPPERSAIDADGFVQKPFDLDTLLNEVRRLAA